MNVHIDIEDQPGPYVIDAKLKVRGLFERAEGILHLWANDSDEPLEFNTPEQAVEFVRANSTEQEKEDIVWTILPKAFALTFDGLKEHLN